MYRVYRPERVKTALTEVNRISRGLVAGVSQARMGRVTKAGGEWLKANVRRRWWRSVLTIDLVVPVASLIVFIAEFGADQLGKYIVHSLVILGVSLAVGFISTRKLRSWRAARDAAFQQLKADLGKSDAAELIRVLDRRS